MLRLHNRPVCMDGRMLDAGTGVSTYARALRAALPLIAEQRMLLSAGASEPSRLGRFLAALSPFPRQARLVVGGSAGEEGLLVHPDLFRQSQVHFDIHHRLLAVDAPGPPGIMHWTYPVPLRMRGWINLYTVHDAIPLVRPDLSPVDPVRHRRLLARIVEAAAALVTVSRSARSEIVAALGCPAGMVVDCSQATELSAASAATELPVGLVAGRYLLVCGSIEPRKNIGRILAAHAASGVAMPLVFAGPDGWRAEEFGEAIRAAGAVRLPYLDRAGMLALIAQARALLMPSLAEGFGLPVAEAMALGTPVLTAATGALAETAGGAALEVDPLDVAEMARGIRRLVEDDMLCAVLAAAGRRRADMFTLPRLAAALAGLYGKLIAPAP